MWNFDYDDDGADNGYNDWADDDLYDEDMDDDDGAITDEW